MRTRKAVDIFTAETQRAEKFGYEFIGWNDLPDGSGAYYEKLYDLQADLKLYAIFRAKTYLIRYEYTGAYENEKIPNDCRTIWKYRHNGLPRTPYNDNYNHS